VGVNVSPAADALPEAVTTTHAETSAVIIIRALMDLFFILLLLLKTWSVRCGNTGGNYCGYSVKILG
jgi:hypothetical protein